MSTPTGTVSRISPTEVELALSRVITAEADDVWASLTASDRTAAWIGPWSGEARVGGTIELTMVLEDGSPTVPVRIDACDEPYHVAFTTDSFVLEVRLFPLDNGTELILSQTLDDPSLAESYGPGWEFYLDALLAARDGRPLPRFGDYDPSMAPYYAGLARNL
ncbi:SRPBCC family protein [Glaciihabitans arcticus]|uniref:SRPBCC family protein n=1 Tax=Glaciihabitans arcticus TaxID=2668039 RepID=A0A4Q9GVC2_9MICO|nr:SRPBCC family protein [Glaciihabitans arcticus]TBN57518.1 SRPBCC family protein [Glaciihabitans arcticus]